MSEKERREILLSSLADPLPIFSIFYILHDCKRWCIIIIVYNYKALINALNNNYAFLLRLAP